MVTEVLERVAYVPCLGKVLCVKNTETGRETRCVVVGVADGVVTLEYNEYLTEPDLDTIMNGRLPPKGLFRREVRMWTNGDIEEVSRRYCGRA